MVRNGGGGEGLRREAHSITSRRALWHLPPPPPLPHPTPVNMRACHGEQARAHVYVCLPLPFPPPSLLPPSSSPPHHPLILLPNLRPENLRPGLYGDRPGPVCPLPRALPCSGTDAAAGAVRVHACPSQDQASRVGDFTSPSPPPPQPALRRSGSRGSRALRSLKLNKVYPWFAH